MKIVLSTWSTIDDYNADCDFGLVDLTPILAARILSRMDFIDRLRRTTRHCTKSPFGMPRQDSLQHRTMNRWSGTCPMTGTPSPSCPKALRSRSTRFRPRSVTV